MPKAISTQPKQQQNKKKHTMATLQPIEIPTDRKLTEDDLPSKVQLQQLFEQLGRRAMVTYAYRSAVRVLPLIAKQPFEKTWNRKNSNYCFAIVRALALLERFLRGNLDDMDFDKTLPRAVDEVSRAAASAAYSASDASRLAAKAVAYSSESVAADEIVKASNAARVAASSIVSALKIVFYDDDRTFSGLAYVIKEFTLILSSLQQVAIKQSVRDFNDLVQGVTSLSLLSKPLWFKETPLSCRRLISNMIKQLIYTKLDFLSQDVEALLASQAISPERANIYNESLDYSDDILNSPARLKALFETDATTEENPAVRVLLVGPGGAGKTSLFNLLHNRQKSPSGKPTISIDTQPINLDVHRKAGVKVDIEFDENTNQFNTNKIEITQWDFGGQSTFYNLHRGFMRRENCVYVLVVDSRHEQAPDEWLTQIQHYAQGDGSSENVRVLVVTNAYEGIEREQNHSYLTRKFKKLLTPINNQISSPFFAFNCTEPDDDDGAFNHFVEALLNACDGSQKNVMDTTRQAINWLNGKFEDGQKAVSVSDFAKQCFDMSTSDPKFQMEKNSLENLGFLVDLNKAGVSNGYLVLDTKWITSVAYQAINNTALRETGGKISRDNFKAKVLSQLEDADKNRVIDFLQMQGVAYGFTEHNQAMLFFPDAAPAAEPTNIELLLNNTSSDSPSLQTLTLEYHLPAFPMGLKSFLAIALVKKGVVALQQGSVNVWRDGLLASFNNQVQFIVFYHQAKHKVELNCVYSGEPEQLAKPIHTLHKLINDDNIRGSNPKVLPLLRDEENNNRPDGHTLRDAIFHLLPGYQTMATIPIASGKPKVYLSYAWGKAFEPHYEVSEAIAKALHEDTSIQLMRDKDVMQNGDSIIKFEKRIGRAYQVIVIFSAKSLNSEDCMRELAYLQQTSLREKSDFTQRIIPVILEDVNVKDAVSIIQYEAQWREKLQTLESMAAGTTSQSMNNARELYQSIVSSIADSLTWSADILIKPEKTLSAPSGDQTRSSGQTPSPDKTHSREFVHLIDLIKRRIRDNQHKLLQ